MQVDDNVLVEHSRPQVIRHNAVFNHPPIPGHMGSVMTNVMTDNWYNDMVRGSVYRAGSHNLERAGKFVLGMQARDEDQKTWSMNRFRRSREAARFWHQMDSQLEELKGMKKQYADPAVGEGWPPEQQMASPRAAPGAYPCVGRRCRHSAFPADLHHKGTMPSSLNLRGF